MLMNDRWFIEMNMVRGLGIIDPFVSELVREENGRKVVSYGLSSYGYDIRLDDDVYVFDRNEFGIVDPKKFDKSLLRRLKVHRERLERFVVIPPNSYVLGSSVERFNVPRGMNGICVGKSTYARCGIIVNVTPLESEWEGVLTIEISNSSQSYVKVYVGEGIAQVMFIAGGEMNSKKEHEGMCSNEGVFSE